MEALQEDVKLLLKQMNLEMLGKAGSDVTGFFQC
jgi:hypothetical protein